jgi:hypothetical protein
LAAVFALPAGVEAWFDGLPWSGALEIYCLAAALPFLILVRSGFMRRRGAVLALAGLLFVKLWLAVLAPAAGWDLWVYASPQHRDQQKWERTYQTLWHGGVSAVWDRPYGDWKQFPAEWMNRWGKQKRRHLWLGASLSGWARIPSGHSLVILAQDAKNASFQASDSQGRKWPLPLASSLEQARKAPRLPPPSGAVQVRGRLEFSGHGKWTLIPYLLTPDGRLRPAFGAGVLWRHQEGATASAAWSWALWCAARITDLGLLAFLAAWALAGLARLRRTGYLTVTTAAAGLTALIIPHLLPPLPWGPLQDGTGVLPLAVGICLPLAIFSVLAFRPALGSRLAGLSLLRLVLFVFGPAVIAFFCLLWWPQVGATHLYSLGDDWLVYQNYARQIVLQGDWPHRSQPVFIYQPLYRYVVGLLHAFFGQSALAQHLLDAWAIVGAAAITARLAQGLGVVPGFALGGSLLYLGACLAGGFRHHIGRSMSEHTGMLCMMLAIFLASRAGPRIGSALKPGLLAALAFWLRMDHLGALAAGGTMAIAATGGRLISVWREWLGRFWERRWWLGVYWLFLAAALVLVVLRNWHLSGLAVLDDPANVGRWTINTLSSALIGARRILHADDFVFKWPGLLLWPGTVLGILPLVWRPGPLRNYPLSLSLTLAGLMAPYFFLLPNSSPPRFSIHLLPLACLSLAVLAHHGCTYFFGPPPPQPPENPG